MCVAIERLRRDTGRIPELVPGYLEELPPGPFSGEPLRLTSDAGSFTVFGVGRDARDDGGAIGGTEAPHSPDVGTTVRYAR